MEQIVHCQVTTLNGVNTLPDVHMETLDGVLKTYLTMMVINFCELVRNAKNGSSLNPFNNKSRRQKRPHKSQV